MYKVVVHSIHTHRPSILIMLGVMVATPSPSLVEGSGAVVFSLA